MLNSQSNNFNSISQASIEKVEGWGLQLTIQAMVNSVEKAAQKYDSNHTKNLKITSQLRKNNQFEGSSQTHSLPNYFYPAFLVTKYSPRSFKSLKQTM